LRSSVRIRVASVDDSIELAAGERETARTPGLLRSLPEEIDDDAFSQRIAFLESPGHRGRYVVAVDERDAPLGHALLEPMSLAQNSHVFRLTIVVHPGHTNRGVGRALMNDLLQWADRDQRVEKIALLVRATNSRAIHLYRSCGFVEDGRLEKVLKLADGQYIDDLSMAWHKSPK
jgi:ribosomal protein S18 acetylase RimI-like enzyme